MVGALGHEISAKPLEGIVTYRSAKQVVNCVYVTKPQLQLWTPRLQ